MEYRIELATASASRQVAAIIAETGLQLRFASDTGAEGCESCVRFTGMYLRNSPIERLD